MALSPMSIATQGFIPVSPIHIALQGFIALTLGEINIDCVMNSSLVIRQEATYFKDLEWDFFNITGWTGTLEIKEHPWDVDNLLSTPVTITGPSTVSVLITHLETEALNFGDAVFAITLEKPNGELYLGFEGLARLIFAVSKD